MEEKPKKFNPMDHIVVSDLMKRHSDSPFVEGCDPNYSVEISFNLNDPRVDMNKIVQIEKLFGEMGITFDTGIGNGERDWCFDWSLKGPIRVRVRE